MLSRLPIGYRVWKQIGLFEAGSAEDPRYAYQVFRRHFELVDFAKTRREWVGLEIGPGDSLLSAIIMHAFGASRSYLVDVGDYATNELGPYRDIATFLAQEGLPAHDLLDATSLKEMLAVCNSSYLTHGLSSIRSIPEHTVDFVWSQATLEHIKRSEFPDLMRELRQVIRTDGVCSHRIDLRDHLDYSLNNLRFSDRIWESPLMANSGFYTNRIRFSEMVREFRVAGFSVKVVDVERWHKLPVPKNKLSRDFRGLSDEELCVSRFDVILPQPREAGV